MHEKNYNKLLVIIGPTGTGKTKMAVKLAYILNGEIVSADSRQVYKGMDIGTGKDLHEFRIKNAEGSITKIPYHLIDVVTPKTEFNLAKYLKLANKAIKDIQSRGKLPILVGGTGLYAQAIIDGYNLSGVKPDEKLRDSLEKKSIEQLNQELKKLDRSYDGDLKNKRYLIRYIEMVKQSKKDLKELLVKKRSRYDCLVLGIKFSREVINKRIDKRLIDRIKHEGMIDEIKKLHDNGVSWKRLESFGLEYKFVSQYLRDSPIKSGNDNKMEMIEKLKIAIHQFAKRQMAWYHRWERQGRKIHWIKNYSEAKKIIKEFL